MVKSISGKDKNYRPNDQYFTPKYVFDSLGLEFDLDPAHPPQPTNVPCKRYYTETDDGLAQPWEGLVWCNPPFSKPLPFVEKFIEHGNGLMLVQVSRSKATNLLWENAEAICIVKDAQKFMFETPDGKRKCIFMPVWLFAMGEVATKALKESGLGRVR